MIIKTVNYFINKNIKLVKEDFNILIVQSKNDEINNMKLFYGEIQDNNFCIYSHFGSKLHCPTLQGKLFEENLNQTRIEIKVIASLFYWILDFGWLITFLCVLLFGKIDQKWKELALWINIILIILTVLFFPVIDNVNYFIKLNELLEDIEFYSEGYYDEQIDKIKKIIN